MWYDEEGVRVIFRGSIDIFELVEVGGSYFGIFAFNYIKREMIREYIY